MQFFLGWLPQEIDTETHGRTNNPFPQDLLKMVKDEGWGREESYWKTKIKPIPFVKMNLNPGIGKLWQVTQMYVKETKRTRYLILRL